MAQNHNLLTVDEAAFLLKVGTPTIESLINRGILAVHAEGGEQRVQRAAVVDLLRRNQQELDYREPDEPAQDFGLMGKRTDE